MPEPAVPGEDDGHDVLGRSDHDSRRLQREAGEREQTRRTPQRAVEATADLGGDGGWARVSEPAASDPAAGSAGRPGSLAERVQAAAGGLEPLLAQAEAAQRDRAAAASERGAPRWTDVFTTQFTEFSNRPR